MTSPVRRVVTVRGIALGAGRPEIIVPLTGADEETVLAQAEAARTAPARVLEWRCDLLDPAAQAADHRRRVLALLPALRRAAGERALLLTLRTAAEGGARELADAELAALLVDAVVPGPEGPLVDLVDVEASRSAGAVRGVVAAARAHGVAVLGSWHDWEGTPAREEIVARLRAQRALGVDVVKAAVTPRAPEDVLTLLAASLEAAADEGAGPQIVLAMGALGAVTRAAAETFGSCASFATVGEASAPGQLPAADLARMLELLRP